MGMTTISTKRDRVYKRLFDHEECRRLRAAGGWTREALAKHYGVSVARIDQILNPKLRAKVDLASKMRLVAVCEDCGGDCTKNWSSRHARTDRVVCRACSFQRKREEYLLSRLDENGDIRCVKCGTHHPVDMYTMDRGFPVGRCRTCRGQARSDYRHRNLDKARAYEREYKRRISAEK